MLGWLDSPLLQRLGRWQGAPLALAILAVLMVVRAFELAPVGETLRLYLFDQWQTLAPREGAQAPVRIVDIDEESLRRYGQWPWPRSHIASLVDWLNDAGAGVIGFDLFFPEPDRLSPSRIIDNFAEVDPETAGSLDIALRGAIHSLPSYDTRFAESVGKANVVLGMAALKKNLGGVAAPEFTRTPYREIGGSTAGVLPQFDEVIHTIDEIAIAAKGHGTITAIPERDGVVRRIPLALRIGDVTYPALTIEMLRIAAQQKWFTVTRDADQIESISVGPFAVPTEADGQLWLRFTEHQPWRYVSAADLLDGTADPNDFRGHLVLVASTGLGLVDFIRTPIEERMPGVEVHAQALDVILKGGALTRPTYTLWIELGLLLFAGLVVIVLVPPLRPVWTPVPYAGLFALLLGISWIGFDQFSLLLDTSFTIVCTGILYSVMLATTRAAIERARRILEVQLAEERHAAARLDGELSAARDIQMGILPREFPAYPDRTDFSIYAMIEPARQVGGDLYDFGLVDDDHLFFMVGDVAGKGVPASLFMAITKVLYKSNALRDHGAIDTIMNHANAEMSRENPAMLFVTVVAGLLDLRDGSLEICNAGHDAPFLLRSGDPLSTLESEGGPPMCVLDDFEYSSERFTLKPGDSIVIVTDGITEAMNRQEELYGLERTKQVLASISQDAPAEKIAETLVDDIQVFIDGAEQSDDTTIMVVRYNGPAVA